jgi:hypothetical protein
VRLFVKSLCTEQLGLRFLVSKLLKFLALQRPCSATSLLSNVSAALRCAVKARAPFKAEADVSSSRLYSFRLTESHAGTAGLHRCVRSHIRALHPSRLSATVNGTCCSLPIRAAPLRAALRYSIHAPGCRHQVSHADSIGSFGSSQHRPAQAHAAGSWPSRRWLKRCKRPVESLTPLVECPRRVVRFKSRGVGYPFAGQLFDTPIAASELLSVFGPEP